MTPRLGIWCSILLSYGDRAALLPRLGALFIAFGAGAAAACPPPGGLPPVAAAADGPLELRLADGRTLRLAGLHVPDAVAPDARRLLAEALAAGPAVVAPLRAEPDRYGRLAGRAMVAGRWLEGQLAAAGLALATIAPGEADCAGALLEREREGRRARAGLWASVPGPVLRADDRAALGAARGRFALAAGTVLSVGRRDYATFLNFGSRWTEALAVMVRRQDRARIEAAHGPLEALRGRRLLVRGVLDPGAAPRLALSAPEALEVLDGR